MEGRLTDRALALWWPLSSEPPSLSLTRLLPPPDCPERRLRGARPFPICQQGRQVSLRSRRVQAEGSRRGQEGEASVTPMPTAANILPDSGSPCARLTASQTTSLGLGGPGYLQLGQRLHSGPGSHDLERPRRLLGWWAAEAEAPLCPGFAGVALPAPGRSWAVPGCVRKQGLVWLRQ